MRRTVVQYTASEEFGGAERAMLTLIESLDPARWRSVLFYHPAPGLEGLLDEARRLGIELRALPWMRGRARAIAAARMFLALRRERPAVFHAQLNWPRGCKAGLLVARSARVPAVIATVHLFVPTEDPRAIRRLRFVARGVDRYLAVSSDIARRLRANFGFPDEQVTVVHNALPPADGEAGPDPALRRALGGERRPLVLTLARLHEQKGHQYLLDAAALVPDAVFLLAGEGALREPLERRARELGLGDRVRFLGRRTDVSALLGVADLFVLPSLNEGLPLSVLEAMRAGTPVIATAIPGTDELVRHEQNGLLVRAGDAAALAAAVRRLLGDRALASRLAAAARDRVRREFTAAAMAQQVASIYESALTRRGAPGSARAAFSVCR